ncbi:fumarylacetoacetate hydrolase [Halorubrum laminariae]|uniref:Fumarylacetoacetate hydrolase n=1 Tax=Halorubrum laminariae TaxID=1433523 RepID=A0ABD6C1Z0_9EURY
MRYHQLNISGDRRISVRREGATYDLTSADADLRSFGDVARAASVAGSSVDEIAARLLDDADTVAEAFVANHATVPVDATEVWAAGVTYAISEQAREAESSMPDMYLDVYDAERPEIFFKATPSRTVGPGEAVGVRSDSTWNVPEPELGIVLRRGEIVGYTVGNDVRGVHPLNRPPVESDRLDIVRTDEPLFCCHGTNSQSQVSVKYVGDRSTTSDPTSAERARASIHIS